MFPYIYKVKWYDEQKIETSYGLTFAENFTQASRFIVDYFGEENIASIKIEGIGDGSHNILELDKEHAELLAEKYR